ncbi:MAG: hypothetical protein HOL91_01930, partial [Actinobacteria bacterium]|nr:hypothetical protein [Actinomycetota bacterium]
MTAGHIDVNDATVVFLGLVTGAGAVTGFGVFSTGSTAAGFAGFLGGAGTGGAGTGGAGTGGAGTGGAGTTGL